ncbi:MAG: prepilin-type N-terminal cleavage/methylation domain-containing protein [Sedimentisphaerales bacterium]|nr:prepilin-type N-terminal cleavage/methylation domain-containing protein [Sedimentisphaerales bacterium]
MKQKYKNNGYFSKSGFTLAEALTALVIAAMVMITAVGVYTGIRKSEAAINRRLVAGTLSTEILQRIAEDIDRLALPSSEVTLSVKNKTESGIYKSAQMIIESQIYDKNNKPQISEKIIWQSHADPDANGLIIYRSHSGYTVEDKMLDEPKEDYELEMFIPICSGATLFSIEIVKDVNTTVDVWQGSELPPALRISLSFTEPQEDVLGDKVIPEDAIRKRTVVVDRFRPLAYQFVYKEFFGPNSMDETDFDEFSDDVNEPSDANDMESDEESDRDKTSVPD